MLLSGDGCEKNQGEKEEKKEEEEKELLTSSYCSPSMGVESMSVTSSNPCIYRKQYRGHMACEEGRIGSKGG